MIIKWARAGSVSLAMLLGPSIALAHPGAEYQWLPFAMTHDAIHNLVKLPGVAVLLVLLGMLTVIGLLASRRSRLADQFVPFKNSSRIGRNTDVEPSP